MQNVKLQLMNWQQFTNSDLPKLALDRISKLEAALLQFRAILEDTVSETDNETNYESDNIAVSMLHLRQAASVLDD